MSPIKGIEIVFNLWIWGVGFRIDFGTAYPTFISIELGPFDIIINKKQYFKNGLFKFERQVI